MEELQSFTVLWPESSEKPSLRPFWVPHPSSCSSLRRVWQEQEVASHGWALGLIQRSRTSWGVCLSPFPVGRPDNALSSTQMREHARISSCSSRVPLGFLTGQQIGFSTIAYSLVLPASTSKNEKKEKTQGFQTLSHHSFITNSHWLSTSWPLAFQLHFCPSHRETLWHITG